MPPTPSPPPLRAAASGPTSPRWPGLALVAALAALAWQAGGAVPVLGAAVCGLLLGLGLRAVWRPHPACAPGIGYAARTLLQGSIVLLGFGLDLGVVARTGLGALPVTLVTLAVAFVAAWWLGRALRVPGRLGLLVGVGTAICGGSAIAAVAPIVRPREHETAYALGTIFLFNVVAVLLFPPLGHLLHLDDAGFGTWAGTAINDTSSVVAAGYAFSREAGDVATVVKLTRAALIVPVSLVLALAVARRGRRGDAAGLDLRRMVPWFVLWFLAASAVRSAGLVPAPALPVLHAAASFLMVMALAAVGLSVDPARMAATGPRPVLLGLGTWLAVAASSLLVQGALARA